MNEEILLYTPLSIKGSRASGLPLSLLYASRELYAHGHKLRFIDKNSSLNPYNEIRQRAKDSNILCITSMTGYQIIDGLKVSKIAKEVNPNIKVIWGGWHVSLLPQQSIKNKYIDIIVVGQGEDALLQIVRAIENGDGLENIRGLCTKESIDIHPAICKDINSYNRVPFEIIDVEKYIYQTEFGERNIDYVSSYGCPYNCGFCCVQLIYNRRWTGLTAETVIKDIKWFKEKYNISSVTFSDTNYFNNFKRVSDICKGLIDQEIRIRWGNAQGRAEQLSKADDQFWKLLVDSGCYSILIGAESGDEEVLKLINKQISVDDIYRIEEKAKRYNIKLLYSFLTGIDMEKRENRDFRKTLELIRSLGSRRNRYLLNVYEPYPGTELYKMSVNHGFIPPKTLEGWGEFCNYAQKFTPWQSNRLVENVAFFSQYIFMFLDKGSLSLILSLVNKTNYFKRFLVECLYNMFYWICFLRWGLKFYKCRVDYYSFRCLKKFA